MIYGPKTDGTYGVEFRTSEGAVLAISIPRSEAAVIQHFQQRMPYGLFVPDEPKHGDAMTQRSRKRPDPPRGGRRVGACHDAHGGNGARVMTN
jgi:hypothetical protein